MATKYPRREKRKRETRSALIEAASGLFAEQGFDETTLQEVAARADTHLQTLYRHFASKSDLAAAIDRDNFLAFKAAIARREHNALLFWRQWVERSAVEIGASGDRYRKAIVNLFSVPTMSTTYLETWHQYQETLASAIAEDMQVAADMDPRPVLIASMLWGGNTFVLRRWMMAEESRDLRADSVAMVDEVIGLFGHLLSYQ